MENYLGEIRMFAGNFAPQDWALCNGQLLDISQNDTLFSLLGTTYGGDGEVTFALPNLQSRIPVHQGKGMNLTPRVLGQTGGEDAHTLSMAEMSSHDHTIAATSGTATTETASSSVLYATVTPNGDTYGLYTTSAPPAAPAATMAPGMLTSSGGGQSHDNTMPTVTLNFIIAMVGIYPTQN